MITLPVYNLQGGVVGEVTVSEELLKREACEQAVHDVVVNHLARLRRGTASTRNKGAVAGSNRKPWPQKGTGRARAGYRQSPVWRGGGVAFGPHPREYGGKINRKVRRLAFCRVMSEKLDSGAVKVVESLAFSAARTKELVALRKALKANAAVLFVTDTADRNFMLAARNLPDVAVANAKDVEVYQLLRYPILVITTEGLRIVQQRMTGRGSNR
ncbi:MAG: 50S ribosomal protein L4 [Kiritimatiellia bacterium]